MDNVESSIKYLCKSASVLNGSDHVSTVIKSHILTQCVELSAFKYTLPGNIFGPQSRCSNCCTSWIDNKFTSKIIKSKLSKSAIRRYKNIIKNKDGKKSQNEINKAKLNLFGNKVVINCFVCKKNTEIQLPKRNLTENLSDAKKSRIKTNINDNCIIVKTNTIHKTEDIQKTVRNKKTKNAHLLYQSTESSPVPLSKSAVKVDTPNVSAKKKRHKDKFAGLCKIACNSSPKITPMKNNNPLSLFLK